jgi:HTH-type transcriptional regulator / antitoxin HigA
MHRPFEGQSRGHLTDQNPRDYRRVLTEIEGLMTAKRNTAEGDRLDVLVTLIEAWERKHYPLDLPDPVEAIKYHMDQAGLHPRDLIPFIGSRNRVYEILNRRRPLTLKMNVLEEMIVRDVGYHDWEMSRLRRMEYGSRPIALGSASD